MNAPLRGQPGAAVREQHSVVPLHGSPMPSDPAQLLATRQPQKARGGKTRVILIAGGIGLAAQLLAPAEMKPATIFGRIVAGSSAPTMYQGADVQIKLAHDALVGQHLADLQWRYSEAHAKCGFAALLDPELKQACEALVDTNFVPAIRQLQAQLGQ